MNPLSDLPPDQRAVVALILRRQRSYAELGEMLSIDPDAVRARAHAALRALAPDAARRLTPERQAEVADYLLGQQPSDRRAATRAALEASAGERAWARVLASELGSMGGASLAEIPAEGTGPPPAPVAGPSAVADGPLEPAPAAQGPLEPLVPAPAAQPPRRSSSRLGGWILIAGLGILVAVLVVVFATGGKGKGPSTDSQAAASTPTTPSTTTQGAQTAPRPKVINVIRLAATQAGSKATGAVEVAVVRGQLGLIVGGRNLAPTARNEVYGVWLYDSPTKAYFLGGARASGTNGQFLNSAALPRNAATYHRLIVTRQPVVRGVRVPKQPGPIVLSGRFSLRPAKR